MCAQLSTADPAESPVPSAGISPVHTTPLPTRAHADVIQVLGRSLSLSRKLTSFCAPSAYGAPGQSVVPSRRVPASHECSYKLLWHCPLQSDSPPISCSCSPCGLLIFLRPGITNPADSSLPPESQTIVQSSPQPVPPTDSSDTQNCRFPQPIALSCRATRPMSMDHPPSVRLLPMRTLPASQFHLLLLHPQRFSEDIRPP